MHKKIHKNMQIVRMDDFKLEGGELFKESFRKLLSQEWKPLKKTIDKEFSLPK